MTLEANLPVGPLPLYGVMRLQWNRMSPAVRQEISRQEFQQFPIPILSYVRT